MNDHDLLIRIDERVEGICKQMEEQRAIYTVAVAAITFILYVGVTCAVKFWR